MDEMNKFTLLRATVFIIPQGVLKTAHPVNG